MRTPQRQNDELICTKCGKRWDANDPDPPECVTEIKPKLIGISGRAGSGKSTVADHLISQHGFRRVKFASPLKMMFRELLAQAGVNAIDINAMIEGDLKETPSDLLCGKTPRFVMQTLGTEWGRDLIGQDLWVNITRNAIQNVLAAGWGVVVDDVRYENETALIREIGGKIVHLYGRDSVVSRDHPSETGVTYDMAFENSGTLLELTTWFDHVFDLR